MKVIDNCPFLADGAALTKHAATMTESSPANNLILGCVWLKLLQGDSEVGDGGHASSMSWLLYSVQVHIIRSL